MPRCLELASHRPVNELEHRDRDSRDPVDRPHWHMRWLVGQGHTCPTVARLTGYSVNWVRTIVQRYNTDGAAGVIDRRHANPGQPPLLSAARREELWAALATDPPDGGLGTSPKVAAWLTERLDRPVSKQRAWEAVQQLGVTLHQPRTRATKADPAAQAAFQKGGAATR